MTTAAMQTKGSEAFSSMADSASKKTKKTVIYLGADATSVDAGRPWKDAAGIRGIWHPEHSLHAQYDPDRYDVTTNKQFAALVEQTRAGGVPSPIAIRRNGLLKEGSPELKFLQANYSPRKEEPVVETVWGNSRLMAALIVNAELAVIGEKPIRVPCLHKPMTDAMAARAFSAENNIRQGNSLYQNVQIVEARLAGGGAYEDLIMELGMPADELRRMYEPLRGQPKEVVYAYAKSKISLADVRKIGKLHDAGKLNALADCLARQGDWAPKVRQPRGERLRKVALRPAVCEALIKALEGAENLPEELREALAALKGPAAEQPAEVAG